MSTETSFDGPLLAEALRHIDEISANVPIATTLRELQLVVERVTFSRVYEREVQNDPATLAEIDLFFRDEVSNGMVQFIRWVAEQERLAGLAGEQGRVFLDHCMSEYRKVEEVRVVTSIELSDDHRAALAQKLRRVHPEPARILFSTSAALVAGFVIEAGQSVVDKSLRTHVANTVSRTGRLRSLAASNGDQNG